MFGKVKRYFAITAIVAVMLLLVSPVDAQEASTRKLTDTGAGRNWYLSVSFMTNYFMMGADIEEDAALVKNLFSGKQLNLKLLQYDLNLTMQSDDEVRRTDTFIIPTIDIGFGYKLGKHTIEFDLGLITIQMNTVSEQTGMTVTETDGTTMYDQGFVGDVSKGDNGDEGRYDLNVSLNEDIWIVSPMVFYDYTVMEERWGRISAGGGLGLMFISMRQRLEFVATRTDVGSDSEEQRQIEAETTITSIGDFGPVMRLNLGYRKTLTSSMNLQVRMGINYGYVTLNKHVDGSMMMYAGETLVISSPLSSMTVDGNVIESDDTSKMELMGGFIQAGIQF